MSSSFCILGYLEDSNKFSHWYDLYDKIKDSPLGWGTVTIDCEDFYVIGYDIQDMKDTETLLDFKKRILNDLNKYYNENISKDDLEFYVSDGIS